MFNLPYEFFLALRYLRPKRTFVSVITLISVIGVTLGVAVLIIVISVMTGFGKELQDKILGFNAHLRVVHHNRAMNNYEVLRQVIDREPGVKGVAPYLLGQVMMQTQPEDEDPQVYAPWVKGINPQDEESISNLHTNIFAGRLDLTGNGVLIGAEMAALFRLTVGDTIVIHAPSDLLKMKESRGSEEEEVIVPDEYEIRGIFDVGFYEYNSSFLISSLRTAQKLYGLDNAVHGLMVMLDDPFHAEAIRLALEQKLGHDYRISIWTEENSGILNALVVEKSVMFYLLFFIMIVAAFGIMNSLITFVVQKTHEIGMLKALGATRGQVVKLFLGQSFVVGLIGVATGLGLGLLGLFYRNEFLGVMNNFTGLELFPAQIYGFRKLPALIRTDDIAIICGSALLICLLAGALPAWIASRLKPVEALRHE